jgi:hypothetical protein
MSSARATFRSVPARAGRCDQPIWLRARGTRTWIYRMAGQIAAGRYVLYSRATNRRGARETVFSEALGNRRGFTVSLRRSR